MDRIGRIATAITLAMILSAGSHRVQNPNFTQPPAKEGYSYPDCYCTDSTGKRVEMGQTACLQIGSRQVLARCDISVNNPTWRYKSEGCPSV